MISSDTTVNKYKTDGEQAIFPVTYPIYKSTDLKVLLSDGTHAETILLIDTDYTVSINADHSGGMVIMSAPPPSGHILAISLNLPLVQNLDLSSTNTVSTEALETELDKQVQMIQQISDAVNLAVQVPVTSDKTPNQLMDDIFTARDEAQASAEAAAQSATEAEKSAVDAAASESRAKEYQERSCQCADRAEQARDAALAQAVATNELMVAETSKINAIVAANKDDQQAAIARAKAWADSDIPPDPDDPESKSAKTWARVAEENVIENLPTTSKTQKGVMQVGQRLTVTPGGVVDAPLASESEQGMGRSATTAEVESGVTKDDGPAYVTPETGRSAYQLLGDIRLLPFRHNKLPFGWYYMNGVRYASGTPQDEVLRGFDADFKADWGITTTDEGTNVPNFFHTDGRGPVMRAITGVDRQVGSIEEGCIQSHRHGTANNVVNNIGASAGSPGPINLGGYGQYDYSKGAGQGEFNIYSDYCGENETRMLNRGMTPAIFLGV